MLACILPELHSDGARIYIHLVENYFRTISRFTNRAEYYPRRLYHSRAIHVKLNVKTKRLGMQI